MHIDLFNFNVSSIKSLMVQSEMSAIYGTGLDTTDGNEVLPGEEEWGVGTHLWEKAGNCSPWGPERPRFQSHSVTSYLWGLGSNLDRYLWRAGYVGSNLGQCLTECLPCHMPGTVHPISVIFTRRLGEAPCSVEVTQQVGRCG